MNISVPSKDNAYQKDDLDLRATLGRLEQLERREWFRWGAAAAITLALTAGLAVLSFTGECNGIDHNRLQLSIRGLLATVLLFDVFVFYQQVLITRLRRQLTSQLGLIAVLDLIKHPESEGQEKGETPVERRRLVRYQFDQQVKVKTPTGGSSGIQGRIRDMSEHGLGVIIPAALNPGESVTLEFEADGYPLALKAVVSNKRGFRYGLEFTGLTKRDTEVLRRLRLQQLASEPARATS